MPAALTDESACSTLIDKLTFPRSICLLHSLRNWNSFSENDLGIRSDSSRNLLFRDLISTVYFVLPESKLAMPYPVIDFIMCKDRFLVGKSAKVGKSERFNLLTPDLPTFGHL